MARALLSAAASASSRVGASCIHLHVVQADADTLRLYAGAGFVEVARDPSTVKVTKGIAPRLLMKLELRDGDK